MVTDVTLPASTAAMKSLKSSFSAVGLRLVEQVEEQDHHQADHEPECEIFIELVHDLPL